MSATSTYRTTRRLAQQHLAPKAMAYAFGRATLTTLTYHRVQEDSAPGETADPELISCAPAEFGAQLDYLSRHFTVVSLDEVVSHLDGRRRLPARSLLITFDDGYLDNHDLAAPELQARSLPAVFFVTTGFIGTSDPMWWDFCRYAVLGTRARSAELPLLGRRSLATRAERESTYVEVRELLKLVGDHERRAALRELCERLDVEPATRGPAFMDVAELRSLVRRGFAVQAHTVTHPILSRLEDSQARDEISGSIRTLDEIVESPQIAFAYPNGRPIDIGAASVQALVEAGVRIAFTTIPGPDKLRELEREPFLARRISVERRDDLGRFALKLMGAARLGGVVRRLRLPGRVPKKRSNDTPGIYPGTSARSRPQEAA